MARKKRSSSDKPKKLKVNKYGCPKRRKGDWRHGMTIKYTVGRTARRGKVTIGERKCSIHKKCDCLRRSDQTAMSLVYTR